MNQGARPVGYIDRDANGAANIGECGVYQMLGLDRPVALCHKPRGD